MNRHIKNLFGYLVLFIMVAGCASGHCRGKTVAENRSVFVFKPDGSLQCEQGSGTPLADMAKELDGISIRSQVNKSDGRMYMMMCGGPTGKINVYEIAEKDLNKALAKKFRNFAELEASKNTSGK